MSRYFQNLNIQENLITSNVVCENISVNSNLLSNLIPSTNLLDLGNVSNPWNQTYSDNLNLVSSTGNITLSNSGNGKLTVTSPSGSFSIGPSSFTQVAYNTDTTISSGDLIFDGFVATGTIAYNNSNGEFSLNGGKVYRISIGLSPTLQENTFFEFAVVDSSNNALSKAFQAISINGSYTNGNTGALEFIYAPVSDINIKIRIINTSAGNINFFNNVYSGCLIQEI
jgi:hypothetical protein